MVGWPTPCQSARAADEAARSTYSLLNCGGSAIDLAEHDVLGTNHGDYIGDHVPSGHFVKRCEVRKPGCANLKPIGLVGAVCDQVDAELALGRFNGRIRLAGGYVHALGNQLEMVYEFFHVPMSVRAMKQGAADFITKPPEGKVLLEVIARAMDRAVRNAAFKAEIDSIQRRIATLTPREHEVMEHVVAGRLSKQIAGDIGTVLKTVKVHRGRVMKKMEVHTLVDLVRCIAKISSIVPRNG